MADGTAPQCGRVGSCHIYYKKPFRNERLFYWIEVKRNLELGIRNWEFGIGLMPEVVVRIGIWNFVIWNFGLVGTGSCR